MQRHKVLFGCFLFSITMVGVAAGLRMAEINSEKKSKEDAVAKREETGRQISYMDRSFFSDLIKNASEILSGDKTGDTTSGKTSLKSPTSGKSAVPADPVKAEAYLVGDIDTGKILFEKNSSRVYPFASMSKLITALVAEDIYTASTSITITEANAAVPPDGSMLKAGERFTVNELFYPMLLSSSNVAAEAIGSSSDRTAFLELMSSYSWEIGMSDSYFADPTGLSERNAGTARGFFAMAQYLFSKRPEILAITRVPKFSLATTTEHGSHEIVNIHPFVEDKRFLGGKTGRTDAAQETMLTILKMEGKNIAFIVLRSPYTRASDTQMLVDRVAKLLASR